MPLSAFFFFFANDGSIKAYMISTKTFALIANIIFQSAIKLVLHETKVPYLFNYMPTAHSN